MDADLAIKVVLWCLSLGAVVYLAAGARYMYLWAKRVNFTVRGDGLEAVAVLVLLLIVWPSIWMAERELYDE